MNSQSPQSCLIIAGEKSGEEHTLSFFRELKENLPDCHFFGVGGDDLKNQGMEILYHLNDFSSWGYSDVILKIPFYKKAMANILNEVERRKCKVAILVDFQSFNLKLAGLLKLKGVDVLYYVAPQAWAWKEYRVKKIAQSVHTLFTIIPFEKKWFQSRGVPVVISVDHPMWTTYKNDLANLDKKFDFHNPLKILLLPGSRINEVESLLPIFIESIKNLKKEIPLHVTIVKSSSVPEALFAPYENFFDQVYDNYYLTSALIDTDFAIAASGTVTLTCALYEVPTIVCYKTSILNQLIYDAVVSYRGFVSLANIVQNISIFPEFLQDSASSYNIVSHLKNWYYNKEDYKKVKEQLKQTKHLVRGENIDVPVYMSQIVKNSYGKKIDTPL